MARANDQRQRGKKSEERETRRRAAKRRRVIRTSAVVGGAGIALVALLILAWPSPEAGDTSAEAWDLPELGGEGRVRIADYHGAPTVAAFFASWCEVCEHEIPEYLDVSKQLGDQVNFIGIDTQDNGTGLADAEKWGIAGVWPIARDIGGSTGNGLSTGTFGARGSPMTVFYDEAGAVVHVQPGGLTGIQLLDALSQFFGVEA